MSPALPCPALVESGNTGGAVVWCVKGGTPVRRMGKRMYGSTEKRTREPSMYSNVMMPVPTLGVATVWDRQRGQALSLSPSVFYFFFSLSFLVSLNNPRGFHLFFLVGFFFYVIMPVMSMRMICRVRSIKLKGLRSPRSPNQTNVWMVG